MHDISIFTKMLNFVMRQSGFFLTPVREKPAKEWQQYATLSTPGPGTMRLGTKEPQWRPASIFFA
jgi:hypothetical protein